MSGGWKKNGLCRKCGKPRSPKGHDPCIKNLPGVIFACCGHGVGNGYIYFENGTVVRMTITEVKQVTPDELVTSKELARSLRDDESS